LKAKKWKTRGMSLARKKNPQPEMLMIKENRETLKGTYRQTVERKNG